MKIKPYQSGNEKNILELFNISFKKEMSFEYWKWRFLDNPISNTMIYLMWDRDKLVGHYAVSPNLLSVENEIYLSALSMTTMTHPDYGGRGIFTQLATHLYNMEFQARNLNMIWGFPNKFSHRGFIKNLGWKNITLISNLSLLSTEYRFSRSNSKQFSLIDKLGIGHVNNNRRLLKNYHVKMIKDVNYYYWRYNLNPSNKYLMFSNDDSDFLVVKEFRQNGVLELDIVEWCVPNDFTKMKDAINTLFTHFKDNKFLVSKLNLWLPLDDERYINFELMGFSNRGPITFMGYRCMNKSLLVSNKNWFYQMGDSDVY